MVIRYDDKDIEPESREFWHNLSSTLSGVRCVPYPSARGKRDSGMTWLSSPDVLGEYSIRPFLVLIWRRQLKRDH